MKANASFMRRACKERDNYMKQPTDMNKRVLIIANNDTKIGADADIANYRQFFCRKEGGCWNPDEILDIYAPTALELWTYVGMHRLAELDYLIAIFSGHGGYDRETNQTTLCLRGDTIDPDVCISDKDLNSIADRQLTIIDSCRAWDEEEASDMVKSARHILTESNLRGQYRAAYENQIRSVLDDNDDDDVRLTLYACEIGQSTAGEMKVGGDFSLALQNYSYISRNATSYPSIYRSIENAFDAISRAPHLNNPECKGNSHLKKLPWILNNNN